MIPKTRNQSTEKSLKSVSLAQRSRGYTDGRSGIAPEEASVSYLEGYREGKLEHAQDPLNFWKATQIHECDRCGCDHH